MSDCRHCKGDGAVWTRDRKTTNRHVFRCYCKDGRYDIKLQLYQVWSQEFYTYYELETEFHERRSLEKKARQDQKSAPSLGSKQTNEGEK